MKYLHLKTGGFYELLHIAVTSDTLKPAVVYQNDDGVVFVRLASEFFDGRFEPVLDAGIDRTPSPFWMTEPELEDE